MSTIRSKAPTFRLEREKLKELKEERVTIKKGRGCLFPFFLEDAGKPRYISSPFEFMEGWNKMGFLDGESLKSESRPSGLE